mgnify:CR=1 FL=1
MVLLVARPARPYPVRASTPRVDLFMYSLGKRRELLHGVLRILEVVRLGIHLRVLGKVLDECHLEPFLAVRIAPGLLQVP